MQVAEARELTEGSQVYLLDGVGRVNKDSVYDYVAGPFVDGPMNYALVIRNPKNKRLLTYNLGDLAIKPAMPIEGETWVKRSDNLQRYVAGVTDNFVILKGSAGMHNSRAHVMEMHTFLTTYRKLVS